MKQKLIPHIIIFLIVLCFVFLTIPYGLGVSPDSVFYIQVANNISLHKGIVNDAGQFVNHWPPGYTLTLGFLKNLTGLSIATLGICLNALLLAANGYLFLCILKALKLKRSFMYMGIITLLCSLPFTVYRMFWSETLFIPLLLATFLYVLKWHQYQKGKYLIVAGIISGFFFLTRYAGAGFMSGFIIIIFFNSKHLKTKITNSLLYTLPILFICLPWFVYSKIMSDTGTDRHMVFHFIEIDKLITSLKTVTSWFTGSTMQYKLIGLPLLCIILALSVIIFSKHHTVFKNKMISYQKEIKMVLLIMSAYYFFLLISISFFDALTPLDHRMLAPLFPFILILMLFVLQIVSELSKNKYYGNTLFLLFLLLIPYTSFPIWKEHYAAGTEYTGKVFKDSKMLAYAREHQDQILYSNANELINFYFPINSIETPSTQNPFSNTDNTEYQKDIEQLYNDVVYHNASIIYFDLVAEWRPFLITKEELMTLFKNEAVIYFEDGFIIRKKD